MRWTASLVLALLVIVSCGDDERTPDGTAGTGDSDQVRSTERTSTGTQVYPDVLEVSVTPVGDEYRFEVTISSPYDTPERYADAWRVMGPDGTVFGVRELLHDHAAEQPFTRSLGGVIIPDDVDVVTIEARDSENGWGGTTMDVQLTD